MKTFLFACIFAGTGVALYAGFSSGVYLQHTSGEILTESQWEVGNGIKTDSSVQDPTDEAKLVRGAAARLSAALLMPGCGVTASGGGQANQAMKDLLDSMIENNQFCREAAAMAKHHKTNGHEAASKGGLGGIGPKGHFVRYGQKALPYPTLPGEFNATGPGISIVFEQFLPQLASPDSPASQALLASIIAHELFHLTEGHTTTNPSNEAAAYFAEAEFICCLIQTLDPNIPAENLAIESLCNRADQVQKRYCANGGTNQLPNCCVNPAGPWPPKTPPTPPFNSLPRPPMGETDVMGSGASHSDNTGAWRALLNSSENTLHIYRNSPVETGMWDYDLSVFLDVNFDAQWLVGGNQKQLYIAGKDRLTLSGKLYRIDTGWSQGAPVLAVTLVYSGGAFSDVVGMGFTGPQNNCVAIFDWTNAKLVNVDVMSGVATTLADPSSRPEIELMGSMLVAPVFGSAGLQLGVSYSFQEEAGFDQSPLHTTRKQLSLFDIGADGSIDHMVYSTP